MLVLFMGVSGCDSPNGVRHVYVRNAPSKMKDAGLFADYLNKNYRYNRQPKYMATAWVAFKKEHPEVKTSFKTITRYLDYKEIKIAKNFGGGNFKKDDAVADNTDDFINVWLFMINSTIDEETNQSLQTEETEGLNELESEGVEQADAAAEGEADAADAGDAGGDAGGDGGDGGDGGGD